MVRTLKTTATIAALAGVLALTTAPAYATILTLPFVGDIEHPDFDPLHIMSPAPADPAPAAAPMKKHHHKMKKKMMKKKM